MRACMYISILGFKLSNDHIFTPFAYPTIAIYISLHRTTIYGHLLLIKIWFLSMIVQKYECTERKACLLSRIITSNYIDLPWSYEYIFSLNLLLLLYPSFPLKARAWACEVSFRLITHAAQFQAPWAVRRLAAPRRAGLVSQKIDEILQISALRGVQKCENLVDLEISWKMTIWS